MRASKERAFHHGLCRPQRHVPAQQNYELKIVFMHGCRRKVFVHVHGFRTCMVMNALPRMHGRKSTFFHC